jgi:hypothetical protein
MTEIQVFEDRQWMYNGQKSSPSSPYFGELFSDKQNE